MTGYGGKELGAAMVALERACCTSCNKCVTTKIAPFDTVSAMRQWLEESILLFTTLDDKIPDNPYKKGYRVARTILTQVLDKLNKLDATAKEMSGT